MKRFPSSDSRAPFGFFAWLGQTRIALPLKGVEARFHVSGQVASVELDQIYHQDADRPLDFVYTFPLPGDAAVYRCLIQINDRTIVARVEKKSDARRLFQKAKADGRRAGMVETERANVFTLSLGNIQPGDVIVVRLAWFELLAREGGSYRLLIPTCPGVRYIPGKPLLRFSSGRGTVGDTDQVPDASRITPPRIDALHPGAASFCVAGRLSLGDVRSGTVSSPSHAVHVVEREGEAAVALSGRDAVPDRDFVVSWSELETPSPVPLGWSFRSGEERYALVQMRAPRDVDAPGSDPRDFYFLLDRSSSMEGAKWTGACAALRRFVQLMGDGDRVWITLFESEFLDFAEAPLPAREVAGDAGFRRMESLGVQGGTELLPAAEHVLREMAAHSAGRRRAVVLITDGQVGNEEAILRAFARAEDLVVHTFGIDDAVNDAFLKTLALQHGGACRLQTPNDDIAGAVVSLGDRLRQPVLTGLAVAGGWESGSERLPDLFAGELVALTLRGLAGDRVEITGQLPGGVEHRFSVLLREDGSEAIPLLWAKERIGSLLREKQEEEAIALAKHHHLLCAGAAFVAWDDVECVSIATQELVQPSLLRYGSSAAACYSPCGESDDTTFGDFIPGFRVGSSEVEESPGMASPEILSLLLEDSLPTLQEHGFTLEESARLGAWVQQDRKLAACRYEAVGKAVNLLERIGKSECPDPLPSLLCARLRQALTSQLEELDRWMSAGGAAMKALLSLNARMKDLGAPIEQTRELLGRLVADGLLEEPRTAGIESLEARLKRVPFGAAARERFWDALLAPVAESASA